MKKFKLYGFSNNNPVLITNSESISPASTFDETLNVKRNSQYVLNFKIADKLPDGNYNLFLNLLSPKNKIRLELDGTTISNVGASVADNLFAVIVGGNPQLHGLSQNQKITLKSTGTITGLITDHTYYVLVVNPYSFQLSETYAGSPIDIGGTDSFVTIQYNTKIIDFIINSSSTEFYQDIIVYSFEAEDYANILYSKLGIGLTINKTGTIKELLEEILASSKINSYYTGASYNYIETTNSKYKSIINAEMSETGVLKSYTLTNTQPVSISYFRNKSSISLQNYTLEFNTSLLTNTVSYIVEQYNLFGIKIDAATTSGSIVYVEGTANYLTSLTFQPAETMSYFTITFSTTEISNQSIICSDFKLNKVLDEVNIKQYIHIDDSFTLDYEDFKSTTPSYSYYKKATLDLSNSNLYNALIELAHIFKAYVYFNYDNPNTITFKSQENSSFKGYRLSPQFNLLTIGRTEESSEFVTALNIMGNENVTSVIPKIPADFFVYFQDCIDNNFEGEEFFETYGTGTGQMTYTSKALELAGLNPAKKDEYLAFAYACDKVPNFENVIYNINYFKKINRISQLEYDTFYDFINNGLRKLNIKIRVYRELYEKANDELMAIEDEVAFNANNITVENLVIDQLNKTLSKNYEYNDLQVQIIGDNLLKNSNFGVYGQEEFGDYAYQYQIPTGWTLSDTNFKKFQVNRDILSPSENTTVKFKDLNDPNSYELYLDENDMIDIKDFNIVDGKYTSPFMLSASVYLDSGFNSVKYQPYIALRYKTVSGSTFSYTIINKVLLNNFTLKQWHTIESLIPASTIPSTAISISIVLGVNKTVYAPDESICYFGDPQLEPRTFRTPWNNEPVAAINTIGYNMISNSEFGIVDDNNNPATWSTSNLGNFTVGSDPKYLNDNKNYLTFNYSSTLKLNSYIGSNYIDLNLYELGNRFVTFSVYINKPAGATLDIPMYISIGTYTKDKLSQGANNPNQEIGLKVITESTISQTDKWIRINTRGYIPEKNDYGTVRYIRAIIGYYKTNTTIIGKSTDKLLFSMPQLELKSSASDWTPWYDPDGDRYASYKFIKDGNQLNNGDLVSLDYIIKNDDYNTNKNIYPAASGKYYVVNSTGESFRLSTTKDGAPILYNGSYDVTTTHNWKITSLAVQKTTDNWINLNNQIADRESSILQARKNIMDLLDIVYNQYYLTPISLDLDNNKLKPGTFLYNLFYVYGFETIYKNGLQDKIDNLQSLIDVEYNDYVKNKTKFQETIIKLDDDTLTNRKRLLLESEKEGYNYNNEKKKFTIGLFESESEILYNNQRILGFIDTPVDLQTVDRYKYIDVSSISIEIESVSSLTDKYIRIYSLDGTENYLRKILSYDNVNKILHIEYFTKLAKPYNYYVVEINSDINNPYVLGQYQNELYYYKLLNVFLSSYIYQKSLIDDTVWAIRYQAFDEDITARIIAATSEWDYTGNALITKAEYGSNNNLDYMAKLYTGTEFWTSTVEVETAGNYELKCLFKTVVETGGNFAAIVDGLEMQVLNSSGTVLYRQLADILNQSWNLNKTSITTTKTGGGTPVSAINLTPGTYTIKFINNCTEVSKMSVLLYKPYFSLQIPETADNYLTDEELLSLRDNPQLIDYIESGSINVDKQVGLYNYVINLNYSGNFILAKNNFLTNLYKNYKNYIFEGFYENSDEVDSTGLLEQALLANEKFRVPNIQFSTSILDLSAIEGYKFLNIDVNDKIIIAEPMDRLYKSYTDEATKYLVISEINYNMRDIGSTSITVSIDDEKHRILQKILQNIN